MKAILLKEHGGPENLFVGEAEDLMPGHNEVLIDVKATALNRADLLQREGLYPPPRGASPILGLEMAGVVSAIGEHESRWKIGDRVCGLLSGGGYAEQVIIHEMMLLPLPDEISFEEGAGIPEVFLTAYQALIWLAKIKPKESICIHAGASGVGTAAIQIAKKVGCKVYVTASGGKHELCKSLGAELAINYKNQDFEQIILDHTQGKGVDMVLDFLGASYLQKNINILDMDGRMVMLALMGGTMVDTLNIANILRKRIQIMGSTLRARKLVYKIKLTKAFSLDYLDLFRQGLMKPIIDSTYSWNEVSEAHTYMESNQNKGKIILKID